MFERVAACLLGVVARPTWLTITAVITLLVHPASAFAQDAVPTPEATVTPYRPTVSNPAELPVPGRLEIEAGWIRTASGDTSRRSLPYLAKFAFNPEWGVLVGGDLRVWDNSSGLALAGRGDTSITVKHRIGTGNEALNFGFEAGVKLPTAAAGLGSDKRDWTVNGIVSIDLAEDWRLDANLGVTALGVRDPGLGADSMLAAVALSRSLGAWTVAGEFSQSWQTAAPRASQWLLALAYAVGPRLVLDAGFSRGKDGEDRPRSVFMGLSWLTDWMF
jgi:Putative MetA-pathway of phenol degradation